MAASRPLARLAVLAALAGATDAFAADGVKLIFERKPGAESCWDRERFEAKIFAELRCSVWNENADREARVAFEADGNHVRGTFEAFTSGVSEGAPQVFTSRNKTCAVVQDDLARAVATWIHPPGSSGKAPCQDRDDDPLAKVRISARSARVTEPTAGSAPTSVVFELSLDRAAPQPVSVDVTTSDETAVAGEDYEALLRTTVTFEAGEMSRTVAVRVHGDEQTESPETFTLDLEHPSPNAEVSARSHATATIIDTTFVPVVVSIGNADAKEPEPGKTRTLGFPVTLDRVHDEPVELYVTTIDDTAKTPDDYAGLYRQLHTIEPGVRETFVAVTVNGDKEYGEGVETFEVQLLDASLNARIGVDRAAGTIRNLPAPPDVRLGVPVYAGIDGGYLFWSGGREGFDQNTQTLTFSGAVVAGGERPIRGAYTFDVAVIGLAASRRDTRYRVFFERMGPRTGRDEKKYFVYENTTASGIRAAVRRDEGDTSATLGAFVGNWFQDGCRESRGKRRAGDPICQSFEQWVILPTFGLRLGPERGPYARLGFLDGRFLATDIGHLAAGAVLANGIRVEAGAVAAYDGVGTKIEASIPLGRIWVIPMVASGTPYSTFTQTEERSTASWFRAGVILGMRQ